MDYILGIDVGTSNVKAVLFDTDGNEIFVSCCESQTFYNGNFVEQDMLAVWENVYACVKSVADIISKGEFHVVSIGITGQGEGCWLIDSKGNPVQNAMLWCDGRAVDEVKALTVDTPEIGTLYHKTTGSPPLTGSAIMLLKWMQQHNTDVLNKASYLLSCKDWIRYKMTGNINGEITDSFMSLIDVETNNVATELMSALDLSDYRSYIPSPLWSDDIAGILLDSLADEWGLPHGLPVIAGAVDTGATALGLGAIKENDACVILGTTCACETVLKKENCSFGSEGSRYEKHPIHSLYVELQPTMNGTPNIDWMLKNIALTNDFSEIDAMVSKAPVGCGGVIYHPYISAAGERAPFYHPYARAGFFGLSQSTSREVMIRAVYEGISLSIRDCLSSVDRSGTIYLAGGGAKSAVWAQMIADVLGMRVVVSKGKEFGAKGIALIAGVATGLYADYDEAVQKACHFERVFFPDAINVKKYELLYNLYKEIRLDYMQLWTLHHSVWEEIRVLDLAYS